jgi:hypothetical protein
LQVLRVRGKPLTRELRLVSADAQILPNAIRELASSLIGALSRGDRPRLRRSIA